MYQKHQESQNIKRSMVVLSLSLVLVYIVLYYAKGDLWKQNQYYSTNVEGEVVISEINQNTGNGNNLDGIDLNAALVEFEEPINLHGDLEFNSQSEIIDNDIVVEVPLDEKQYDRTNSQFILSGTKNYYGELDFVEKLGISYEYALKDEKNIYYLYMGEYDYDFSDIARKLKGSLYVINTEQELIANGLFGEKVTYINIPAYKDQIVLILLEIDNGSWLLAINYSIYYQVKPYLKTLFID